MSKGVDTKDEHKTDRQLPKTTKKKRCMKTVAVFSVSVSQNVVKRIQEKPQDMLINVACSQVASAGANCGPLE